MPSPLLRAPRRGAVVALLGATLGAAGCGASGTGDTDPASLVPPSAPVYAEAVVRPDGAQGADAQAALRRILRTTDPDARVATVFDRAARRHGVTWARDIDPWLGDRVGAARLVPADGERGREDGVVVAASADDDRAAEALAKLVPGAHERTHRDVAYRYARDERSAGVVLDGALVLGTERGVRAAIDASKDSSLADGDRLKDARDAVPEARVGFLYADTGRLLGASLGATGPGTQQSFAPFLDSLARVLPHTVAAALDPEPDLLRIEGAALGGEAGARRGDASAALGALPGDAWLGIGVGDLGASLNDTLDRIGAAGGLSGIGLEVLLRQLRERVGLDVRRDLLAWMGSAGLFATGTSPADGGMGLVVASKDPAATRRAVGALEALARRHSGGGDVDALRAAGVDEGFVVRASGRERDLYVAAAGDRFVIASGEGALRDALRPTGRLGDAAALRGAAGRLGGDVRPSFYVDLQRAARHRGTGARARGARSKLEAFGVAVGGTTRHGDTTRGRAVVTLR